MVRFPGQELQDSHLQAPVWSETVTSTNQRYHTAGTLPQIPMLLYCQYPVLWFEHHGIEERIGVSELVKFTDDNTNRNKPKIKQRESPEWADQSEKKNGVELHVDASTN
jgi:hypothetical protein